MGAVFSKAPNVFLKIIGVCFIRKHFQFSFGKFTWQFLSKNRFNTKFSELFSFSI